MSTNSLAALQHRPAAQCIVAEKLAASADAAQSSRDSTVKRGRLEFLDAIRGFAALAVVLEHSCERFYPGYLNWANSHITLGVFGVVVFFLVSGFIIPISMERYKSLPKFWDARFFRLYPMYWVSLVFQLGIGLAGLIRMTPMFYLHPIKVAVANTTMLQAFVGIPDVMGVCWTLSLELVFYILCSILFLSGLLSRSVLCAWAAFIGNVLLNTALGLIFHRSLPAGRMGLLATAFFGTLIYRVYTKEIGASVVWLTAPFALLSLSVGFWFRFAKFPSSFDEDRFTFAGVVGSYAAAYLFFALLYSLRKHQFPDPILWLGRISYSLYLLHGFVLKAIPPGSYPLPRLAAVACISIAISGITFRYIEQPALAIHRRRTARRSVQQPLALSEQPTL